MLSTFCYNNKTELYTIYYIYPEKSRTRTWGDLLYLVDMHNNNLLLKKYCYFFWKKKVEVYTQL